MEIEFGVLSASINIQNIFMEIKWSRISRNRYLKISTRIDFGIIISVLTEIGVLPVEIRIGVLSLSINIQDISVLINNIQDISVLINNIQDIFS